METEIKNQQIEHLYRIEEEIYTILENLFLNKEKIVEKNENITQHILPNMISVFVEGIYGIYEISLINEKKGNSLIIELINNGKKILFNIVFEPMKPNIKYNFLNGEEFFITPYFHIDYEEVYILEELINILKKVEY